MRDCGDGRDFATGCGESGAVSSGEVTGTSRFPPSHLAPFDSPQPDINEANKRTKIIAMLRITPFFQKNLAD